MAAEIRTTLLISAPRFRYFDALHSKNEDQPPLDLGDGLKPIDFRGEAITFRETTAGVIITLQHCLDIISQKEESFKRKLDREQERRRKAEELYRCVSLVPRF